MPGIVERLLGGTRDFITAGEDPNLPLNLAVGQSVRSPLGWALRAKRVLDLIGDGGPAVTGGAEVLAAKGLDRIAEAQAFLDRTLPSAAAGPDPRLTGRADLPGIVRQAERGFDASADQPFPDRLRAANEAGARGNERAQGLLNAGLDPLNFLGVGGEVAAARGLTKLATAMKLADLAQNLPAEGAMKLGGKVVPPLYRLAGSPGAETTLAAREALRRLRQRALLRAAGSDVPEGALGQLALTEGPPQGLLPEGGPDLGGVAAPPPAGNAAFPVPQFPGPETPPGRYSPRALPGTEVGPLALPPLRPAPAPYVPRALPGPPEPAVPPLPADLPRPSALGGALRRAGAGALGGAGAGAFAGGVGESAKQRQADGTYVDALGNPTTPPDVLAGGAKGALVGGVAGAGLGALGLLRKPAVGVGEDLLGSGLSPEAVVAARQAGADMAARLDANPAHWLDGEPTEAAEEALAPHVADLPLVSGDKSAKATAQSVPNLEANAPLADALPLPTTPGAYLAEVATRMGKAVKTALGIFPDTAAAWAEAPARFQAAIDQANAQDPRILQAADSGMAAAKEMLRVRQAGALDATAAAKAWFWIMLSNNSAPYPHEANFVLAESPMLRPLLERARQGFKTPEERAAWLATDWEAFVNHLKAQAGDMSRPNDWDERNAARQLGYGIEEYLAKRAEDPDLPVSDWQRATYAADHKQAGKPKPKQQPIPEEGRPAHMPSQLRNVGKALANWGEGMNAWTDLLNKPEKYSGAQLRREFYRLGMGGRGVDNKLLSFYLLMMGSPDVSVIDIIQARNFHEGAFRAIGDAARKAGDKKWLTTATDAIAKRYGNGPQGLANYEALERLLSVTSKAVFGEVDNAKLHYYAWVMRDMRIVEHGSLDPSLALSRAGLVFPEQQYGPLPATEGFKLPSTKKVGGVTKKVLVDSARYADPTLPGPATLGQTLDPLLHRSVMEGDPSSPHFGSRFGKGAMGAGEAVSRVFQIPTEPFTYGDWRGAMPEALHGTYTDSLTKHIEVPLREALARLGVSIDVGQGMQGIFENTLNRFVPILAGVGKGLENSPDAHTLVEGLAAALGKAWDQKAAVLHRVTREGDTVAGRNNTIALDVIGADPALLAKALPFDFGAQQLPNGRLRIGNYDNLPEDEFHAIVDQAVTAAGGDTSASVLHSIAGSYFTQGAQYDEAIRAADALHASRAGGDGGALGPQGGDPAGAGGGGFAGLVDLLARLRDEHDAGWRPGHFPADGGAGGAAVHAAGDAGALPGGREAGPVSLLGAGLGPQQLGRLSAPAARALAGGLGGGAVGALLPADTAEDRKRNIGLTAAAGAGLGAAKFLAPTAVARGVTGLAPGSTWRMVGERALEAGGASQAASNALVSGKRLFPNIKDWGKLWRQQVVQTPKNLLGDESWGRLVLGMLQGGAASGLKALRADAASYLHLATEWERMPVAIRGTLANIGKGGYVPQLGESMSQTTRSKVFSTAEHSLFEAGLNLVNPAGFAQSAFGVAGAAAKGAARPWWIGVFQTVNDFQHATFRYAAFEDELTHLLAGAAADFKAHLASQGHNVNPLTDSGGFSPQLVAKLAGAQEAARWRAISDRAVGLAEERAKFLFGDYGVPNKLEEALGGVVPFMGWALRAYPVAVQMALDHPVVALGLYHILAASSQGAGENGRPGYTAGMIPVPTSTPFVGPLLAALVPGGNGVAYIDPVGSISPVGGEALQPGEDMTGKTWYQKVLAGLGRTGLPGPNPAIKAAGYLTGLDYQPPGALSRTAGLENAAALLPESVNPRLPNTGGMLLAAGRRAISPAVGPAIGGEADPGAAVYDPVTRRYAELVLEQTGKPLADPANRAYLLAANDPDNPLLDQARRELLTSGAAKAAVSATSPVGVVARGATPAAAAAATAATPFTQAQIDAAVPALADAMTGANARYGRMTPASATYRGITPTQRQDIVLGDFDRAKRGLQQVMPKTVANQRATERLKLWDAEHLRLRKVSPAEYERQRAAFIDKLAGSPVLAP